MVEKSWELLRERLKRGQGRRSLLAGLAGASLIGGAGGTPGDAAASGSTLRLCPGTFRVTSTLAIEKDLILVGEGADETILNGEDQDRVLVVGGARTVTVEHLTITQGFAAGEERCGSIANSGDLALHRMTVSSCEAHMGGGVALLVGSALTMLGSRIERNTARDDGGGILNGGTVTMNEGSFVTDNTALGEEGGGGISGFGANVTLNDGSVVAGNDPDDCDTESGDCS